MNAAQLYEIVKDVPTEARPVSDDGDSTLEWHGGLKGFVWFHKMRAIRLEDNPRGQWEASITRWLAKQDKGCPWILDEGDDDWNVINTDGYTEVSHRSKSLTAALASACRAVAKEVA